MGPEGSAEVSEDGNHEHDVDSVKRRGTIGVRPAAGLEGQADNAWQPHRENREGEEEWEGAGKVLRLEREM